MALSMPWSAGIWGGGRGLVTGYGEAACPG